MELSSSARVYLENYHVLEIARGECTQYLRGIIEESSEVVMGKYKSMNHPIFSLRRLIQSTGGYMELNFIPHRAGTHPLTEDFKFYVSYKDVTYENGEMSPTACVISGFSPKKNSRTRTNVIETAAKLGIPDPYEKTTIDLLEKPYEETVANIARVLDERIAQFLKIAGALIPKEAL